MPNLTREERLRRIGEDQGNPEDTVFLNPSFHARTYHGTPECCELDGVNEREVTRRVGQDRIFAPCMNCVDGVEKREWESVGGGISKLERVLRDDKETPAGFGGVADD